MKKCTNINKDMDCDKEELGCEGCYYYKDDEEDQNKEKEGE